MLISLVHDGQLTDEEHRFLEQAVLRYPELKLEIYRHERLHDLMGMVPNAAAPRDIEDRVFEAIRSERPETGPGRIIPFPRRRFSVEIAGAIAATVVIVLVGIISYPRLMGTDHKTAALPHDTAGTSTAAVTMAGAPEESVENAPRSAEDVALAPKDNNKFVVDRYREGEIGDKAAPIPDVGGGMFSPEISPSAILTATGVTAEKVSKIIVPAHEAPLSAAKREAPMISTTISTTYISSTPGSEESLPPTILLIYNDDPSKAQKDIMDTAVSLGGTVTRNDMDKLKGSDEKKTDLNTEAEEDQGETISLPPEKVGDLLDYLAARYPENKKEIRDIKGRKATLFLRIDVVPTIK